MVLLPPGVGKTRGKFIVVSGIPVAVASVDPDPPPTSLHTAAASLFLQPVRQPQVSIGGMGFVTEQHDFAWKTTVFQFLSRRHQLSVSPYWGRKDAYLPPVTPLKKRSY